MKTEPLREYREWRNKLHTSRITTAEAVQLWVWYNRATGRNEHANPTCPVCVAGMNNLLEKLCKMYKI